MKLGSICLSFHRLRFFCHALAAFPAAGVVNGQEGAAGLPELPTGFAEAAATVIGDGEAPSFGTLDFRVRLLSQYDSNATLGNSQGRIEEISDFSLQPSLKGSFQLGSGSGEWRFGLKGDVIQTNFNELDRFNRTNYSIELNGGYQSRRANLLFNSGYFSRGGLNRFVGSFFEQTSVSSTLTGKYTISPKTSLELALGQNSIGSETTGYADTSSTTSSVAALWQSTPLLRLGPGFRYALRTAEVGGANQDTELRVAGPVLRLDYNLSTKVSLASSFGLGFVDASSGDEELLNWRVGLNYRASSLWSLNLKMIRDTQATFLREQGFDQVSVYSLGYTRNIRRAHFSLGVSYEDRESKGSSSVVSSFRNSGYLYYTASLGFPVFGNEADLSLSVGWRDFDTADSLQSWNGFQSGLSLTWLF